MSIFNDTLPTNDESVKLGAGRIREVKTTLNSLLSQIFDDSLVFLSKWVTGGMIQNDPSDDSVRAITTDHIKLAAIILDRLPDGVFTADSTGRAKFANGFVNSALLDPTITLPDGSILNAALSLLCIATGNLQDNAVTIPKVATGIAKLAIGSYGGSNSVSAAVSGLDFQPDFILLIGGATHNDVGFAFRSESTANVGPIHNGFPGTNVGSPYTTAIQWTSDGFVVVPTSFTFNANGRTHSYIALKA